MGWVRNCYTDLTKSGSLKEEHSGSKGGIGETANPGYVHMTACEEGLGRVVYVASALEFERGSHGFSVGVTSRRPRFFNREPDDLTNGRTQASSPALEVKLNPDDIQWHVLPQVLGMGQEADEAYRRSKEMETLAHRGVKSRKRKPEERLKLADPS